MANLGAYIGGPYLGTYDAVALGPQEDGFDLIQSLSEEVISESDQYGGSIIDYFYRGGSCQIRCDSKEFKAGTVTPYWPWGAAGTMGQMRSVANPIGRRASDAAKVLVLTGVANVPATEDALANGGKVIDTVTANFAILAPGQQSTLKFSSKLRRVPIFLQLLPWDATVGGVPVTVWYLLA